MGGIFRVDDFDVDHNGNARIKTKFPTAFPAKSNSKFHQKSIYFHQK